MLHRVEESRRTLKQRVTEVKKAVDDINTISAAMQRPWI